MGMFLNAYSARANWTSVISVALRCKHFHIIVRRYKSNLMSPELYFQMASGSVFTKLPQPKFQKDLDQILQQSVRDMWKSIPQDLSAVAVLKAVTCTLDRIRAAS
jgi:hypothetical protein